MLWHLNLHGVHLPSVILCVLPSWFPHLRELSYTIPKLQPISLGVNWAPLLMSIPFSAYPCFSGSLLVPTMHEQQALHCPLRLLFNVFAMAIFCHNGSVLGRPWNNLILFYYNHLLIPYTSVIALLDASLNILWTKDHNCLMINDYRTNYPCWQCSPAFNEPSVDDANESSKMKSR